MTSDPRVQRARHREALVALAATLPPAVPPPRAPRDPSAHRRPLPARDPATAPMWQPRATRRRQHLRGRRLIAAARFAALLAALLAVGALLGGLGAAAGWWP